MYGTCINVQLYIVSDKYHNVPEILSIKYETVRTGTNPTKVTKPQAIVQKVTCTKYIPMYRDILKTK